MSKSPSPLGDIAPSGFPLSAIAAAKGISFGSAVRINQLLDVNYAKALELECHTITPENELKLDALRPRPDVFEFRRADMLVDYARSRKLRVRGHTLLWHHPKWMPKWVESIDFGSRRAGGAIEFVRSHVKTVCEHYADRIFTWDVVNEAVDSKNGELRETALSAAAGSALDVLDAAFHSAKQSVPNCRLVYNDYMNWDTPDFRLGVLRLLEGFRKRNTPVDALGIQAHISAHPSAARAGFDARAERSWRRFLDEVVAMGYELDITEFDANDSAVAGDFFARDLAVSEVSRAFLDCTLAYQAVKSMTVWGLLSPQSWLQYYRNEREDGLPLRCCPYGPEYRPLQLRSAIASALYNCPIREIC